MAREVGLRAPRTAEEVRRELERTRAEVTASMQLLRREVSQSADWREWVRRRPVTLVAAAFLFGVWLARR